MLQRGGLGHERGQAVVEIDARDTGYADDDVAPRLVERGDVGQHHVGVGADERRIRRSRRLDVAEVQIGPAHHSREFHRRQRARSFDGARDAFAACGVEQRQDEVHLHQRLAAGERHASARAGIIGHVPANDAHHGLHVHFGAEKRDRGGGTLRHADAAAVAARLAAKAVRGRLDAAAAADAAAGIARDARADGPVVRIVAPGAAQRTALQEHRRPIAGAIANAGALDARDAPRRAARRRHGGSGAGCRAEPPARD